jgi:putative solute:sodium symporter small subunit
MSSPPEIDRERYWTIQIRRTVGLLAIWFVVGFVLSIFLAEPLNDVSFLGVPFGFWMAQQGSIFVFIGLVFAYAVMTGRLDRRAGVEEEDGEASASSGESR